MDPIDYYERYAGAYYENTIDLRMDEIIDKFLAFLPENAEVLDLGCGSGRDSLYMEENGCYMTLLDGSKEMCKLAEIHTDKEVLHMNYTEMDFDEVFDGIWACASLLHLTEDELDTIMKKVVRALKPGGMLYMSFKYGDAEEIRGNRFFHDHNEETAYDILERYNLSAQDEVQAVEIWKSEDYRENEKEWINVLARKHKGVTEEAYE